MWGSSRVEEEQGRRRRREEGSYCYMTEFCPSLARETEGGGQALTVVAKLALLFCVLTFYFNKTISKASYCIKVVRAERILKKYL